MADERNSGGIYDLWKSTVPMSARMYLQTLFGDRSQPFTEADFSRDDLRAIDKAVLNSQLNSRFRNQETLDALRPKQQELAKAAATYSPTPDKLISTLQKDPEYKRLLQLQSMGMGAPLYPREYNELYALIDRIEQKYQPQLPPGVGIVGGNGIADLRTNYSDAYKKHIAQPKQSIDKVVDDYQRKIAAGGASGSVRYSDFDMFPGTTLSDSPVRNALGRFNYSRSPDGTYRVADTYDFSNEVRDKYVKEYAQMTPIERALTVAGRSAQGVLQRGHLRAPLDEIANAYIGKNGRAVDIRYNPADLKETK
jgi:hypothetical protein